MKKNLGLVLTRNDLKSEALKRLKGGYKCDLCVGFFTNHTFCKVNDNPGVVKCCLQGPATFTIGGVNYNGCIASSVGCDDQGSTPSSICLCGDPNNPHVCV
ncbi:MAG: hypothetical protein QM528_02095 [Phycisphaerales bacterium]|nr:hypothetical protein [Phycisphaerales bacterium]